MKPTVTFESSGMSGNIYAILGRVKDALRKERRINDYNTMRDRVLSSGSYDEALGIIREYVVLIDNNGRY